MAAEKIAKRAGIKKRIYPHLFRHTRATRLLAKVPESIGAKYMGWVNGSKMVGVYVHLAGIEAERRASRKVETEDVERVYEGGAKIFLAKSISALNSDERETLKIIYSIKGDVNSGDVYKILKAEVGMSYTRFYEIINKLERLRLIDVAMGRKGRGRTRYMIKKYDQDVVMAALEL